MNCKNCGAPLRPNARFCGVCGTPVSNPGTAGQPEKPAGLKREPYRPASRERLAESGQAESKQENYRPVRREKQTEPGQVESKQENYRPARREKQSSPKQESYIPTGKKHVPKTGMDFEVDPSEMKTIRKYFLSQRILPTVLIIVGIPLIFAMGIGLIFIVIGIVLMLRSNYKGEDVVDRAVTRQIRNLKKRGLDKLNLIQNQVSLIDPVILIGIGASPDSSFDAARAATQIKNKKGLFHYFNIFNLFKKKKSDGTENDPVEAMRIGSDDCLRTLLIEVSVYVFTEQQLFMYKGDVDISTGLVYSEMTAECFYQDIEGMNFSQSIYKVFSQKKKKYMNKIMESFTLYLGGCKFSASMNTEMNDSALDNQFTAMRNLIRDKKNS